jgi:hypothetical protein
MWPLQHMRFGSSPVETCVEDESHVLYSSNAELIQAGVNIILTHGRHLWPACRAVRPAHDPVKGRWDPRSYTRAIDAGLYRVTSDNNQIL